VRDFHQLRIADIGCGYNAHFARTLLPQVRSLALADLAIAEDLKKDPKITALEGRLPASLAPLEDGSQDVVICNSVIEHLFEPLDTLSHLTRICAGGRRGCDQCAGVAWEMASVARCFPSRGCTGGRNGRSQDVEAVFGRSEFSCSNMKAD
jgi:SAM-dependent methyltransferase